MAGPTRSTPDFDHTTSTGLLQAARQEDPAAWERLIELYGRLVLYWCRRAGLGEADRADVFQDVFRTVHRQLHQFRKRQTGDSFRGWLRTMTRHKTIDFLRNKQRHTAATGGSEAAAQLHQVQDPWAPFDNDSDLDRDRLLVLEQGLEMIRDEFEPKTWTAFWRTAADGIATPVVAAELGMSAAAVRKAKSRVLQRLRAQFAELEDVDDLLGLPPTNAGDDTP